MSIPVELSDLEAATQDYGWAYLLTVRDDGRAHIVAVEPEWQDGTLVIRVGRGTSANAAVRPQIAVCYPPREPDGYSLIVDGDAEADVGDATTIRFRPTGAVLHRPAAPGFGGSATGCSNDCAPVAASSDG